MKYTVSDIKQMLRNFKNSELRIKQLTFELNNMVWVSSDEMIESMTLSSGLGQYVSKGGHSDNTAYVAMHYADRRHELNLDSYKDIRKELNEEIVRRDRLLYYIELLDDNLKEIIVKIYLDGMNWREAASELNMASSTFEYRRDKAIRQIADMFNYIAERL